MYPEKFTIEDLQYAGKEIQTFGISVEPAVLE
jgi:hypothetical protein